MTKHPHKRPAEVGAGSESRFQAAGAPDRLKPGLQTVSGPPAADHKPVLVWFRQDLRLADNPALHSALTRSGPVIPIFIWAPDEEGDWAPGAASRFWLHQSLAALDADLRALGSRLVIRRGPTLATLLELARTHQERGDRAAAVAALETLIALDGATDQARDARALLAQLKQPS